MEINAKDRERIAQVPQFSGLGHDTLDRLIAGGLVFAYPRGIVLFHQGDMPECLHVVLDGEVGLTAEGASGETVVEILKPGEMFIAAAVLTNKKYLMGAKVLRPARILLLEAAPFRQMLRDEPDLAIAMLAALSRHFRGLVAEVKNLKLKSSAQRLGLYLLGIGEVRSGAVTLRLPHQKGVIAARIGIRPETLSRHFATLRNVGVRVRGSMVEIRDLERLAAFCRENGEPA